MIKPLVFLATLLPAFCAFSADSTQKTDYSGVYDCVGKDSDAADFTGILTMKLNPAQSLAEHGAYDFDFEVPGFSVYAGHAAAFEKSIALYFALKEPQTKDYGTGIATAFDKDGKLALHKYYYAPEYQGGSYGTEECVRRG